MAEELLRACAMRTLTLALMAGCVYKPGSFSSTTVAFLGQRTTVRCLDIAIDRRDDLPSGAAVIDYRFGNRCDGPVAIDLGRVPVVGRTAAGDEVSLTPFDPTLEIRARL